MINLMNVAAVQDGPAGVQASSAAADQPNVPPEAGGLFAMLLEMVCSDVQTAVAAEPVALVPDAEGDNTSGDASVEMLTPVETDPATGDDTGGATADGGVPTTAVAGSSLPAAACFGQSESPVPAAVSIPSAAAVVETAAPAEPAAATVASTPPDSIQTTTAYDGFGSGQQPVSIEVAPDATPPLGVSFSGTQEQGAASGTTVAESAEVSQVAVQAVPTAGTAVVSPRLAESAVSAEMSVTVRPDAESQPPAGQIPNGPGNGEAAGNVVPEMPPGADRAGDAPVGNRLVQVRSAPAVRPANLHVESQTGMQGAESDPRSADTGGKGNAGGSLYLQPAPSAESAGIAHMAIDEFSAAKPVTGDRVPLEQLGLITRGTADRGHMIRIDQSSVAGRMSAPAPPLVGQVVRIVRVLTNERRTEMRVRMWPPHLGELRVRVVQEGDSLNVRLSAESGIARNLLDARLPELRHALAEVHGWSSDVNVAVDAGEHPSLSAFTPDQGRGYSPHQHTERLAAHQHESPTELTDESPVGPAAGKSLVSADHIDVHA